MSRLLCLALLLGTASAATAQDWQVVWADEFDTPGAPNPAKWGYDIGGNGWGNRERQYYTDRSENARVEDGMLVIEARREAFNGSDYTSARLVTRGRAAWTYGRIEARMKLPFGKGIWPAFWMLPTNSPYGNWPFSGEIDVMEYPNLVSDQIFGTIHYGGGTYAPCRADRGAVTGHCFSGTSTRLPAGSASSEFHTYAVDWSPRQIQWSLDGRVYQTQTYWYSGAGTYPAPFDSPFHLLLNLAVGGSWPGDPDASTVFPQRLEVDYVRVYEDRAAKPAVTLDTPAAGTVGAGSTVALTATATDGGTVTGVEFLQGEGVLGTDIRRPFALDVAGAADGCYSLRARATDNDGYQTTTDPVVLTVGAGCPAGAAWPYLVAPAAVPGTIEAEYYDLGGENVAYGDLTPSNDGGGGIRADEGVDLSPSKDTGGGYDVTRITAREWVTYTVDVAATAQYRIAARTASASGGSLRLSVDGADLFGSVALTATGSDATYGTTVLGEAALTAGRHVIRIDMRAAGFALNNLTLTTVAGTPDEDGPGDDSFGVTVSPNPASERLGVVFRLPEAGEADVAVLDAVGRRVAVLHTGTASAGAHTASVSLDGLAPGVYTCVLKTPAGSRSTRVTVVR